MCSVSTPEPEFWRCNESSTIQTPEVLHIADNQIALRLAASVSSAEGGVVVVPGSAGAGEVERKKQ